MQKISSYLVIFSFLVAFSFFSFNYIQKSNLEGLIYQSALAGGCSGCPEDERNVELCDCDPTDRSICRIICKSGNIDCSPRNCPDPIMQ